MPNARPPLDTWPFGPIVVLARITSCGISVSASAHNTRCVFMDVGRPQTLIMPPPLLALAILPLTECATQVIGLLLGAKRSYPVRTPRSGSDPKPKLMPFTLQLRSAPHTLESRSVFVPIARSRGAALQNERRGRHGVVGFRNRQDAT